MESDCDCVMSTDWEFQILCAETQKASELSQSYIDTWIYNVQHCQGKLESEAQDTSVISSKYCSRHSVTSKT